ncbi:MAG: tetratricopeptide repeat protein [Flavobacteriales bacterium]
MKKISSFLFALALVSSSFAQNVTSAFNANKSGRYDEAVGYIEEAIKNPKDAGKEKTWRYRGNIYFNIANGSQWAAQFPNATQLAMESYLKALEVEPTSSYAEDSKSGLGALQTLMLKNAATQYSVKDYCQAALNFEQVSAISAKFNITDSVAIYNAANAYDNCGNKETALSGYQKCIALKYMMAEVYGDMASLLRSMDRTDEANAVLAEAIVKFPDNEKLIREQVSLYLGAEQFAEAEKLLVTLTEKNPGSDVLWFILGNTYDKLGKMPESEAAYAKALAINPNYFECLFDMGAHSYNNGNTIISEECNKIPTGASNKAAFNDCQAKAMVQYQKSVEFFERAYAVNAKDKMMLSSLKEAYLRVGNMEGVKKMTEELKQ